jgi:hypothetical protein
MDESLRAFSDTLSDPDGDLTLASLACEAFGIIRRILACESPNHAKLAGIAQVIDEFAPPPGPGGGIASGVSPRALSTAAGVAEDIADELRFHPGPATALLERLAGEPARLKNTQDRPVTATERLQLRARPGDDVRSRDADLYTASGIHIACVRLTVITGRLPEDVAAGLDSDIPFGTLAAPHHPSRRGRAATTCCDDPHFAVRAAALLVFGNADLPAAIAAERITRGFCQHVAALPPAPRRLRYTIPGDPCPATRTGRYHFPCGQQRRGGKEPGARGVPGTRPGPPRRLRPRTSTDR